MFKRIKSPVGEMIEPWAYWNLRVEYMTEEEAQDAFGEYLEQAKFFVARRPLFADWLESKGVRLL
jgi:hypothetical protein